MIDPLLHSRLPIASAPMAAGPTTPALAVAVAEAGGFPFLAAGYRTPEAMAAEIERLRPHGIPFGVNLFAPGPADVDRAAFRAYAEELAPEAAAYGLRLDPEPVADDDHWAAKIAYLVAHPVPVVSTMFGLPSADEVARLRRAGIRVLATVTTLGEAQTARAVGVDGLVVQGLAAGGHSATHDPGRPFPSAASEPDVRDTVALVHEVLASVPLPVVAGGGVDGPVAVRMLRDAGAAAVLVGTLLLRTDEAGTSALHRAALADPRFAETVLTRAFTGRPARALRNGFADRHGATAPVAYPAVHRLTRELRRAAARAGDPDGTNLWAGTGYRAAPEGPAGHVLHWLAADL